MSAKPKRILRLRRRWLVLSISLVVTAVYPLLVRAQTPDVQFNNKAVDLGDRGDLRVNPSTRGMEIQLPLANYPGRAGASLPVTLSYSSKVWQLEYNFYNPGHFTSSGNPIGDGYTGVVARYAKHSAAGWTSSLGFPFFDNIPTQYYDFGGSPKPDSNSCGASGCYIIDRELLLMPDGSSHELRSTDQPKSIFDQTPFPDALYAVDGSRMRYQRSTQTLFMPDGSRYLFGSTQYVDRNGNTLTYDGANGRWLDTLGRPINLPLPPLSATAGSYDYSVPGVNASTINYTFVWKNLGDAGVLTTPQPLQYTADSGCPPGNGANSSRLFLSDSGSHTCIINANSVFNPVVLYQIQLPTGRAYTFTYNIYGEIDKVQLPAGGYERFTYSQVPSNNLTGTTYLQANRGIVDRFVSTSGNGSDEAQWHYSGGGITGPISITAPDQSLVERYLGGVIILAGSPPWSYTPDEARSGMAYDERYYSAPDSGGVRHMLRRKLTDWSMTGSNAVGGTGAESATRNARITKEVEILLDTGGGALTKTNTHEFDATYQFSTGLNETATNEYDYVLLDQTNAQTIGIGSIPVGALLRRTEKTYLEAINQAYRDRNLLGLVSSATTKDAAGNILAQSSVNYDEGGQFAQLNDYGNVANWMDPQTTVRGNPTTVTRWLNFDGSGPSTFPNGTYVTAHAQYDQCGSVRKSWDPRDTTLTNPSQVSYSDAFSDGVSRNTYAFPTSVTTAVPDPSGTYGSNAAFVTTSVYDFNTSRVRSATDANGQTTSYDYTDPLNRIKQVTAPNGARVRYNYSDTPGDLYVQVLTDEDTRSIETRKYFDEFGRPVRAFLYDGTPSTPWSVTDTYYDTMGRVSQISNPYRVSTPGASVPAICSVCTTSLYDALGRVTTVTTPDGAQVTTAYAGSTTGTLGTTVSVTDQAGKQRRSLTDAMGRLVRVDEPDVNGSLGDISSPAQPTDYLYDVLGNLLHVYQGSQTRTFTYDSLSRLLSASNPESGQVSYTYDDNGNLSTKTDARSIVSTYAYDALNRIKTITYTNDPASTPTVSRYYDGWRSGSYNSSITNSKGKLWQTETAGSTGTRTTIDGYDVMGRPAQQEQQFKTAGGWSAPYITSQTYDLGSHIVLQTYPSGSAVTYNYDNAGRLADKDATHLAFTGNLGDGGTTMRNYAQGLVYDAASRMTQEQFGTTTAIFNKLSYNSRGQLAEIRSGTAGVDDNRGRIVNDYSGTDNNGNLRKQTVYIPNNDQNTSPTSWYQEYDYDSLNRLQRVHEYTGNTSLDWQQQFVYDRYGNRTIDQTNTWGSNIPKPNFGVNTATNQLTSPSGTMTYDPAGNLSNDTYSGQGQRTYDAENRMMQAWANGQWQTYIYDGDGKRVKRIVNGIETWQVYGLGGELLAEYAANSSAASPQKEYGYRNGQLLITATVTSGWGTAPTLHDNPLVVNETTVQARHITELRDAINALRSHLNMSPYSWQYSVTTNDWITANPILEMRTALDQALGAPSGGYASGLAQGFPIKAIHIQELRDRVLAAWTSGSSTQINWLVTDQLGTPRMVFDQTGSLANVSRHDYLPFGEELFAGVGGRTPQQGYSASDGVRQKFADQERDNETGLDYSQYRYYSSIQGRFTSPDPLLASAKFSDPQSWNRYTYCGNNPLVNVDPLGLLWYHNEQSNEIKWYDNDPGGDWKQWTQYSYYAGEKYGYVALDPRSNHYETGFETQEDAGVYSGAMEYATAMMQDPPHDPHQMDNFMQMQLMLAPVDIAEAGVAALGEEGTELLAKEGIDLTLKEAATATATETAQVILNRAAGKEAEAIVAKQLEAEGYTILGSQVGVRTSQGLRFIDHLVQDPAGNLIAIEVKSGGGTRTGLQVLKDTEMATQGATIVGKNAPARLLGQTLAIPTKVRTVPR